MQTAQHSTSTTKEHGYYGLPVLKQPRWKWEIVLYFWIGGIAAGSYVIAAIADLFGDKHDTPIVKAGRWIALPLLVACPILLIKDLGRPEKFYNMLRIFKLKSPMSVGTWVLTILGGFSALSVVLQRFFSSERWNWARRLTGMLGTPFALLVGGYTGILISATAVPLWFKNRLLWGPTFLASAFSTGSAAIQVLLALTGKDTRYTRARLGRVHMFGLVVETVLIGAGLIHLGSAGNVLTKGKWSTLFLPGTVGMGLVVPLLLDLKKGEASSGRQLVSALCTLAGGLIFRICIVYGGHTSADDAREYFNMTMGKNGRY